MSNLTPLSQQTTHHAHCTLTVASVDPWVAMSSVSSSLLGFITMAQPRKFKERLKTLAAGHEWVKNQPLIVYLKESWITMQTMHWWLIILRTTCNQRQSLKSITWSSFIELRSHKMLSKSSREDNDHVWSSWLRHMGPWKGLCANEWNQKTKLQCKEYLWKLLFV